MLPSWSFPSAWSRAFAFVHALEPGALSLPSELPVAQLRAETLYLSFVTLTTLGYGDVLPISQPAAALAAIEAMIGVLYPAILVARLVSLYR